MKTLFDKTDFAGLVLKNRFFRSATRDGFANASGYVTEALENIYANLAKGGVGAIITGQTFVTDAEQSIQPGQMGICNDSFISDYQPLVQKVHHYNTKIFLQLSCVGAQTFLDTKGKLVWGPSAVKDLATGYTPTAMTKEDIDFLQQCFADAAERAQKAGFDGIEIHAAHGYVLNKFLSPFYNKRGDEYGGRFENRIRMIVETYRAIRAKVVDNFPILIKVNCDDFMTNGTTFHETKRLCRILADAGISAIEISGGTFSSPNNLGPCRMDVEDNESYFGAYAAQIALDVQVPVIVVGGNRTTSRMTHLLNSTNIGYFSICRPLIQEPDLINKWHCDSSYMPKCISCNKCLGLERTVCIFNREDGFD